MKLFWSYIVAHVSTQCFPLYIRLNLLLKVLVFVLRLIDLCFSFDTIQIINSSTVNFTLIFLKSIPPSLVEE